MLLIPEDEPPEKRPVTAPKSECQQEGGQQHQNQRRPVAEGDPKIFPSD